MDVLGVGGKERRCRQEGKFQKSGHFGFWLTEWVSGYLEATNRLSVDITQVSQCQSESGVLMILAANRSSVDHLAQNHSENGVSMRLAANRSSVDHLDSL